MCCGSRTLPKSRTRRGATVDLARQDKTAQSPASRPHTRHGSGLGATYYPLTVLDLENRSIVLCEKPSAHFQTGICAGSLWSKIALKAAIIEGRGFLTPAFSFRHRRFAPGARSTGRGGMRTGKLGSGVLAIDQAAACSKPPIASRVMSSVSSSVKGSSAVMLKGS